MWNFDYILVVFVIFVTLCQSAPIEVGVFPIRATLMSPMSKQLSPSSPPIAPSPSLHAAETDLDYYEDLNFVFNDADHYENLGCDAYGYAYEDY